MPAHRDLLFVVAVGKGLPLQLSPGTPGEEGRSSGACRPQCRGRPSPRLARACPRDSGGIAAGRDRMSAEPAGTLPASGQRRACTDCALSAPGARDAVSARPRARPPSRPPRAATSARGPRPRAPAVAFCLSAPRVPEPPARGSARRRPPTFARCCRHRRRGQVGRASGAGGRSPRRTRSRPRVRPAEGAP